MNFRDCSRILLATLAALWIGGVAQAQEAAKGALHITCEGSNEGAEVSIDGVFKGECPFDMFVAEGTIALRAVKPAGELRERVFAQSYRIGGGTRKAIEIILAEPQLNARGIALRAQADKEAAEAKRKAAEAARAVAEAKLAAEKVAQDAAVARADPMADTMIQARRARMGNAASPCPDCPGMLRDAAMSIEMPAAQDPTIASWIGEIQQDILAYARGDAAFRLPAQQLPAPCETALASLRKAAEIVDFTDRSVDEKASWIIRSGDVSPRLYYRDVQLWPISGTCVDGKLEGVAEAWISANAVSGWPTAGVVMTYPVLVKVKAPFASGVVTRFFSRFTRTGAVLYSDGVARPNSFDRAGFARRDNGGDGDPYTEIAAFLDRPTEKAEIDQSEPIYTRSISVDANGIASAYEFYGRSLAFKYMMKNGYFHGWGVTSSLDYKNLAGKSFHVNAETMCNQNNVRMPDTTACLADRAPW